jgi:predicted nucleotidyltransferase
MNAKLPAEQNLAILSHVAAAIGSLRETLVFVGGCATGLLVTDVRAQPIRATIDVDLVAHVVSTAEYRALEKQFRTLGFTHDITSNVVCRWRSGEITVDLMPTNESILGFHNRWYVLAVETADSLVLPNGLTINLITAPAFIATKVEAFKGRGNNDYLASHDMEDIITVVDGRATLLDEVKRSDLALREYLVVEFSALLTNPRFVESLSGHLPGDSGSQQRLPRLRARLRALAAITDKDA